MKKVTTLQLAPVMQVGPYDRADIVAMQALANGKADEFQQKRALNYIIYDLCKLQGVSFYPTERESSFAEGKRFVAQMINAMLTFNARKLEEPNNDR